jgi:hypothetical protein
MKRNRLIAIAVAVLAIAIGAGCDEGETEAEERGAAAVELCRGHGGVAALDDDIVVCRDQTVHRGEV